MNNKESDTSALAGLNASSNLTNSSEPTITQNPLKNQVFLDGGKAIGKKFSKKNCKCLSIDAKVNSLAIKIYVEQLPYGWDYTSNAIRMTDKKDFQVLAICHNRDTYSDEGHFWKPAFEKPHYHIILRCVDRKKRIRVRTVLRQLGIEFRKDLDDDLWINHGVETVSKFSGYATYLTHETEDAINAGKELYGIDEIVSNLTVEEIQAIRDGYIRISNDARKVTTQDLVELDNTAFELGKDLKNFDDWYNTLPFTVRSNAKIKTIRESYGRGVNAKIAEKSEVLRLCVYIQGAPNTGKTYGAKHALSGKRIYTVEGGGSGKFDDLRADHEAIIISDDVCPNLLNMTDNYICRAYKRQSNNPAWAGNYFIVTSNLSFVDWLASCKINVNSKHYDAMFSRFFVTEIKKKDDGTNYLALKSASTRGSVDEQTERAEMFMNFQKRFNEIMVGYKPEQNQVDFDSMIDESYKNEVEEVESDNKESEVITIYKPVFIEREKIPETFEVDDNKKYDPNSTDRNY